MNVNKITNKNYAYENLSVTQLTKPVLLYEINYTVILFGDLHRKIGKCLSL